MHYNFIEIGTSCFETLLENAGPFDRGLSIEPIKSYLDQLPDNPNVTKLAFAVSPKNTFESLDMYWIPEDVIRAQNLPLWLMGCNILGGYHVQHEKLNLRHLVRIDPVICVPVSYLFTGFKIDSIDLLKIDIEGSDPLIMLQFWDYITSYGKYRQWPKRCEFESNDLADPVAVETVIQKFTAVGYSVIHKGHDTILEMRK